MLMLLQCFGKVCVEHVCCGDVCVWGLYLSLSLCELSISVSSTQEASCCCALVQYSPRSLTGISLNYSVTRVAAAAADDDDDDDDLLIHLFSSFPLHNINFLILTYLCDDDDDILLLDEAEDMDSFIGTAVEGGYIGVAVSGFYRFVLHANQHRLHQFASAAAAAAAAAAVAVAYILLITS
uniref:Secreted protein n=1 Tax=Syphacia muris TaxID=451379 RepID=A0A0N5AUI4_9BILA